MFIYNLTIPLESLNLNNLIIAFIFHLYKLSFPERMRVFSTKTIQLEYTVKNIKKCWQMWSSIRQYIYITKYFINPQ